MESRDEIPESFTCPECGSREATRILSAPAVKRVTYHDGYRRGDGYQLMKEINSLKTQKYNLPAEKRSDIDKEIKKLGAVSLTKKDKTE